MGLTTCPKCGETISEKATVCPCCNSAVKQKQKKHKGVFKSIIVFTLIVVSVLGIGISQKAKELKYYSNMETVSFTMLDGATKAEDAGNLIKSVWYNAIFEERNSETDKYTMKNGKFVDDFNDALSELFADENFSNSISEIVTNQSEVANLVKQLKEPPKKYEEAYSVLKIYYDNYMEMTKIVINPTGSLNTFSEDLNTYDNNTVDSYEKMKLYLDERSGRRYYLWVNIFLIMKMAILLIQSLIIWQ